MPTSDSKNTKSERERWVEAALILGREPEASVLCPRCGSGTLRVVDARAKDTLERHMICDVCHATNSILMRQ